MDHRFRKHLKRACSVAGDRASVLIRAYHEDAMGSTWRRLYKYSTSEQAYRITPFLPYHRSPAKLMPRFQGPCNDPGENRRNGVRTITDMPKRPDQVREAIRRLHYSIRTEDASVQWTKRIILFHRKRHPLEMGETHVIAFLTHPPVRAVHDSDLRQGFGRMCLPHALTEKDPAADRRFGWPYPFPSGRRAADPRTRTARRHHLERHNDWTAHAPCQRDARTRVRPPDSYQPDAPARVHPPDSYQPNAPARVRPPASYQPDAPAGVRPPVRPPDPPAPDPSDARTTVRRRASGQDVSRPDRPSLARRAGIEPARQGVRNPFVIRSSRIRPADGRQAGDPGRRRCQGQQQPHVSPSVALPQPSVQPLASSPPTGKFPRQTLLKKTPPFAFPQRCGIIYPGGACPLSRIFENSVDGISPGEPARDGPSFPR